MPDFIFSVDAPITQEMYKNKVYKKCIHYAPSLEVNRYPKKHCGINNSDLHLIPNNPHWISGSAMDSNNGHKNLYLDLISRVW